MQQNLHASRALVRCGVLPGGGATGTSAAGPTPRSSPFNLGGSDADLITDTQALPHLTQSEDM